MVRGSFVQNANWPRLATIEHFSRDQESKLIDALAHLNSKPCREAYEKEGLRSPKTISNTRGAIVRPAEDLRNRSAADLGLSPKTYRDAQAKVNTGQAGTVFGADGRLHIFLHHTAFTGRSFLAGRLSLQEVVAHEFMHEGLDEWRSHMPGRHDLAGWDGYDRILKACQIE